MGVALAACGGGGGGSTGGGVAGSVAASGGLTLTGTVPGTLIEAFCDDGSYHVVTSTQNGTNRHPFEIPLPAGLACRIVMITNETDPANRVVTPIKLVKRSGQGGIAVSATGRRIDLGHVDLAMSRLAMRADSNGDGVEDIPREIMLDEDDADELEIHHRDADPMDTDNDGIVNRYEDDDQDGLANDQDRDDDGNGIDDDLENDNDLDDDGIENELDVDDDNDGQRDEDDDDDDNDGHPDEVDEDDDNDGVPDEEEDDAASGEDESDETGDNGGVVTPVDPGEPTPGRLLASQCAQCHGTDGRSVSDIDSLVGEGEDLREDMLEMKNSANRDDIMHLQASGYTDAEIQHISDYFASLPDGREE